MVVFVGVVLLSLASGDILHQVRIGVLNTANLQSPVFKLFTHIIRTPIMQFLREQLLSGAGVMAVLVGHAGTWFLLSCLYKIAGGAGAPLVHPRFIRNASRMATPILVIILGTWLFLRATAGTPSLLQEIQGYLREARLDKLTVTVVEDFVAILAVVTAARFAIGLRRVIASPWAEKKAFVIDSGFELARLLPTVARELQREVEKTEAHLEVTLRPGGMDGGLRCLPTKGREAEDVIAEMQLLADGERSKWSGGMASGAIYNGSEEHASMVRKAYALFSHSNPLHPDLWPSGLKFEGEVISMTARLLDGGNEGVCGVLTSGGTESIILAAKAHRDFFRERGVTSPEIVAATSAHAAIDKACTMMEIRLIKVPVDPNTMKADVRSTAKVISANTILIYASAPGFPHGIIDPVEELGRLATAHGCGLHVDCCLGGFVLPFARKLGYPVPPFDFAVPGVTSISADTHKYGYAPKGTSVVLFRRKELRHCAYFCFPDWTGGLYVTPTIAGSRPGALSAACWASMVRMGEEGYRAAVKSIMDTAKEVAEGVSSIEGLSLVGDPKAMVVCFRGESGVNVYKVGDRMSARGWSLNALQKPPCLHLCVTLCHVGKAQNFLQDLKDSTEQARATGGKDDEHSTAAIYGMASSMPAGPVKLMLRAYTDVTLGK